MKKLTLNDIDLLTDNYEIDKLIQYYLFKDEELLPYSTDRNCAAKIIEKIIFSKKTLRDKFNEKMKSRFLAACNIAKIEISDDFFILWATPIEICRTFLISMVLINDL